MYIMNSSKKIEHTPLQAISYRGLLFCRPIKSQAKKQPCYTNGLLHNMVRLSIGIFFPHVLPRVTGFPLLNKYLVGMFFFCRPNGTAASGDKKSKKKSTAKKADQTIALIIYNMSMNFVYYDYRVLFIIFCPVPFITLLQLT